MKIKPNQLFFSERIFAQIKKVKKPREKKKVKQIKQIQTIQQEMQQNKKSTGISLSEFSVLVTNLPAGVDKKQVRNHFAKFNPSGCRLISKAEEALRARVYFETQPQLEGALTLNNSQFQGNFIGVKVWKDSNKVNLPSNKPCLSSNKMTHSSGKMILPSNKPCLPSKGSSLQLSKKKVHHNVSQMGLQHKSGDQTKGNRFGH